MKEYLSKDYKLQTVSDINTLCEIPDGATMLLYCESNNGLYHFANSENKLMATYTMKNGNASWYGDAESYIQFGAEIVWSREQEIKMKEYLDKEKGYVLVKDTAKRSEDWIEVPEGAEFLTCLETNKEEVLIFWKEGHKKCLCCDDYWVSCQPPMSNYMNEHSAQIVWRREKTIEYLDPSDWSLKVVGENSKISGDWILIPEGADTLSGERNRDCCRYFWNHTKKLMIGCGESLSRYPEWEDIKGVTAFNWVKDVADVEILWTRHTQPEELPFIDDKPVNNNGPYERETKSSFNSDDIEYMNGCSFGWTKEIKERNATDIADAALKHIRERAVTYDQADGERSAAKTAKAFNAITGKGITESEVWLMLQLLKDVRQWSRDEYHVDSAEDCIAYAALKAESLEKSNVSHNQGS